MSPRTSKWAESKAVGMQQSKDIFCGKAITGCSSSKRFSCSKNEPVRLSTVKSCVFGKRSLTFAQKMFLRVNHSGLLRWRAWSLTMYAVHILMIAPGVWHRPIANFQKLNSRRFYCISANDQDPGDDTLQLNPKRTQFTPTSLYCLSFCERRTQVLLGDTEANLRHVNSPL